MFEEFVSSMVLCSVFRVLRSVFRVPCSELRVLCSVFCVPCSVFRVLCYVFRVLRSVFCVPCSVFCVPCSVFRVLRSVFCVLCSVFCVVDDRYLKLKKTASKIFLHSSTTHYPLPTTDYLLPTRITSS